MVLWKQLLQYAVSVIHVLGVFRDDNDCWNFLMQCASIREWLSHTVLANHIIHMYTNWRTCTVFVLVGPQKPKIDYLTQASGMWKCVPCTVYYSGHAAGGTCRASIIRCWGMHMCGTVHSSLEPTVLASVYILCCHSPPTYLQARGVRGLQWMCNAVCLLYSLQTQCSVLWSE